MNQMNRIARLAAIAASLAAAVAQTPDGRAAFQTRCAVCHGTDARGGEHAPSIVNQVRRRNDEQLTAVLKQGVPQTGMPAFNDTPEPELRAIVGFLRTLVRPRRGEEEKPEKFTLAGGKSVEGIVIGRTSRELQLRSADGRIAALHGEREALTVHVVAVGDLVAHVHFAGLLRCAEPERDIGIEEIVRCARGARQQCERCQKQERAEESPREKTGKLTHEEGAAFLR